MKNANAQIKEREERRGGTGIEISEGWERVPNELAKSGCFSVDGFFNCFTPFTLSQTLV
jgi:hypothetical protein